MAATWKRDDSMQFCRDLFDDCTRILRLVFATNRVREPEWERLGRRVAALGITPSDFLGRLRRIWADGLSEMARYECHKLVLELLGILCYKEEARAQPRRFLARHCQGVCAALARRTQRSEGCGRGRKQLTQFAC